jgi:hypothetical protein
LAGRLISGEPRQLRKLLERTDALYAGLSFQPGAPLLAEAAVLGRYSADAVSLRLDWSCDWRRNPGEPLSWSHRRLPLEVAAPERGLLLAAYGTQPDARGFLARWRNPGPSPLDTLDRAEPAMRRELLAGSDLYAFLPVLPPAWGGSVLPLSNLWLAARRQGDGYALGALVLLDREPNTADTVDSGVFLRVARLAAAAVLRKVGLADVVGRLQELEVRVSGRTVAVSGLSLSREELLRALGAGPGASR